MMFKPRKFRAYYVAMVLLLPILVIYTMTLRLHRIGMDKPVSEDTEISKQSLTDNPDLYTKQIAAKTDHDYTIKRNAEKEKVYSNEVDSYTKEVNIEIRDSDNDKIEDIESEVIKTTRKRQESVIYSAQKERERNSTEPSPGGEKAGEDPELSYKDKNMKTLLWYDTHKKSMRGHTTTVGFSQCEYKNCQYKVFLSRNDTKPSKPFDVDAILIQSAGILDLSPPPRRDENQVFVLAVRDSFPQLLGGRDPVMKMKWVSLFNWTMTYRLDSDILYKYANILEREDKTELLRKNYDKMFDEKVDKATWFVSHCTTRSMREHYIREMQSVMGVDIFGGCGLPPPCPKGGKNMEKCFDAVAMKYKYYLAFENTLAEDYVTEKVYRWYDRDIIVVVRGGSNYSRILHPGTYVDASDFASPVELGKYLKDLARDKKRYTDILKKKDNYYCSDRFGPPKEANCKLCEYLNNLDDHRNSYDNIIKWWSKGWRNYGLSETPLEGWPMRSSETR